MSERPLSDDTVVIRGGLMESEGTREAIDLCFDRVGFYGLSLAGEEGWPIEQTARVAKLRNNRIRVSRVGRLRALGFEVVRSGKRPHLTVRFRQRPSDEELALLEFSFDPPMPNPTIRT